MKIKFLFAAAITGAMLAFVFQNAYATLAHGISSHTVTFKGRVTVTGKDE